MKYQRTLVFSLVMLALVVLTACGPAAPIEPVEAAPQQSEAVPVIVEENITRSDSDLFAANPELMVADRYPVATANRVLASNSTFFATNPELMVAGRYQDGVKSEAIFASTFFAANPELMIAHRYAAAE